MVPAERERPGGFAARIVAACMASEAASEILRRQPMRSLPFTLYQYLYTEIPEFCQGVFFSGATFPFPSGAGTSKKVSKTYGTTALYKA
jgi:hypothetical protein